MFYEPIQNFILDHPVSGDLVSEIFLGTISFVISVTCPSCEKNIQSREEHSGKRIRCPRCEQSLKVPDSTKDEFRKRGDERTECKGASEQSNTESEDPSSGADEKRPAASGGQSKNEEETKGDKETSDRNLRRSRVRTNRNESNTGRKAPGDGITRRRAGRGRGGEKSLPVLGKVIGATTLVGGLAGATLFGAYVLVFCLEGNAEMAALFPFIFAALFSAGSALFSLLFLKQNLIGYYGLLFCSGLTLLFGFVVFINTPVWKGVFVEMLLTGISLIYLLFLDQKIFD